MSGVLKRLPGVGAEPAQQQLERAAVPRVSAEENAISPVPCCRGSVTFSFSCSVPSSWRVAMIKSWVPFKYSYE